MTPEETHLLHRLLQQQPVAALATLHKGSPAVSMVPFALAGEGQGVLIHVSALSTHTQDMRAHAEVSLLITAPLSEAQTPLALPRVSVSGEACELSSDDAAHAAARAAYLAKLPDAEPLFDFADFSLFLITPRHLRFVAGFGRALSLVGERMQAAWPPAPGTSEPA